VSISRAAIAGVTAAVVVSGCGYRVGAYQGDTRDTRGDTPVTASAVASVQTQPAALPSTPRPASLPARQTVPPNAHGDPACAAPVAWGRQPQGRGVLVSFSTDDPATVVVLVRTQTGADVAERARLDRRDVHLFEFPDIAPEAVREVLIMTNAQRCFAVSDPVTFR
jgi:hypothetical protein